MEKNSIVAVFRALNKARVEYIVAGGMAVIAHGYPRMTFDLDIVLHLERENIIAAIKALRRIGYTPKIPVTAEQFADPALRESWIREKDMRVFQLFSDKHQKSPVDVFVKEPFDFVWWYPRSPVTEIAPGVPFRYTAPEPLLAMKKLADREKDQGDIIFLQRLVNENKKRRRNSR